MSNSNGIIARLVFDGSDQISIPPEMGTPRDDQLQGTPAEQLTELAGRVCYDSLGKGRPSFSGSDIQGYHDHIKQVKHGSVQEHFNFTVEIPLGVSDSLLNDDLCVDNRSLLFGQCCCNRPGVMMFNANKPRGVRITVNLRSVIEWLRWEKSLYGYINPTAMQLAAMLHRLGHELAPHIVPESPEYNGDIVARPGMASEVVFDELRKAVVAEPITDHERWVSVYVTGSRGMSHELVRHGDFTAISQRSTRYVDESEGMWVCHPLLNQWLATEESDQCAMSRVACEQLELEARGVYQRIVDHLEPWLISRGVDKQTARKQARGAARGYLGNALQTELIFSASVSQWKWMLNQRASVFADAEIRELFCKILGQLKQSRYSGSFSEWSQEPSPDGIGQIAVEG